MLVAFCGEVGSGKSRFALSCALAAAKVGRNVYHNLPLTEKGMAVLPPPSADPIFGLEHCPLNSFVVADETGVAAATGIGANQAVKRSWALTRHRGLDVVVVAQDASQITSPLRSLVSETYIMQPPAKIFKWSKKQTVSRYRGCPSASELAAMKPRYRPLLDRFRWSPPDGLHDLYRSIDDGASFVSGVGLPHSSRPSVAARILAMPVFCVILIIGFLAWNGGFSFSDWGSAPPAPVFAAPPSLDYSGTLVLCSSSSPDCWLTLMDGRRISQSRTVPRE